MDNIELTQDEANALIAMPKCGTNASLSGEPKSLKSPISARMVDAETNPIPGIDKAIFKSSFLEEMRQI